MVERKHRHIKNLGLTMIHHAKIPQKLWVQCFAIVIYLINWLSNPTLDMEYSYQHVYGVNPNYCCPRVLNCLCLSYLRNCTKDKFDPKFLPCVFLAYGQIYKG